MKNQNVEKGTDLIQLKMKHAYIISVFVAGLLFSCNSQKKSSAHSHDGLGSHSHEIENSENEHHDYFGSYTLNNPEFGTKTVVTVSGDTRTMVTNALPNHETGTFPNPGNPNTISEQNKTYTFPVNPKYTGIAQWIREPGIAINGIKFEPGTAEIVACETGENYRVEAFQDVVDFGVDFNHAHVQPTGEYHYHGSPTSIIESEDSAEDLVHVGFAHDGFPIYYSKSEAFKSSYKKIEGNREGEDCVYENPGQYKKVTVNGHHDGTFTSDFEYVQDHGDLDECNGMTVDGKYMYIITSEFPYVSRCLMGEVDEDSQRKAGMQGGQGRGEGPNRPGGRPNIAELFSEMDTNKDEKLSKTEALGPLKEDFEKIDVNKDGFLTKEEIENTIRPERRAESPRRQ